MIIVIDASVALKWLVAEQDSDLALPWLESDHVLAAPSHVVGEVGEILCRRARKHLIDREQVEGAFTFFRRNVLLIPLPDLLGLAAEISIATGVAFYDALYVAASDRHRTYVVTADLRLIRLVRGSDWHERVLHFSGDAST